MLTALACERSKPTEPPTTLTTPVAAPELEIAVPESVRSTLEATLVIDCVTAAVEQMGWLAWGAHAGHFIKTARDAGLIPESCDPLTDESYTIGYPLAGGGKLHWFAEEIVPAGTNTDVTLKFTCLEGGCSVRQTRHVSLPPGWYCLGWVHGDDHGTQCFRSQTECEQGRELHHNTTPCSLNVGAAYCATRGNETRCFPSPWACMREGGGSIADGTCTRTDR
jgi:hypothetical protein